MTEEEYIKATNRTRMAVTMDNFRQIVPGAGVTEQEHRQVLRVLSKLNVRLHKEELIDRDGDA